VKYIAKRAAKNINSDANQTMVPTATRLGRLVLTGAWAYVVTGVIIPEIDRQCLIFSSASSPMIW